LLNRAMSFVSIALFALVAARLVHEDRRYALAVVFVAVGLTVPAVLARRRMRRVLLSGDVPRILNTWQASLQRAAHPGTMAPLMNATAYAAYGFIEAAHRALERAERGPAWEAALEQRLFIEALLDVYEGDRGRAEAKALTLAQMPLPAANFWMRRRVALLRRGIAAFARAFAHRSKAGDDRLLRRVSRASPLVHWAMRYAQAVLLVDRGRQQEALALIALAPTWPDESAFRMFHSELVDAATPPTTNGTQSCA
jgi:hypothetical protein